MRDDDFEAFIKLKALLETESWTEDYYYPPSSNPDSNDDDDGPIPQDCNPDKWSFISTNGTAFRGKWVNRNASRTNPGGEIIVDLVPKDEEERRMYGEDYETRCESMFECLLQEVQLCMPPPVERPSRRSGCVEGGSGGLAPQGPRYQDRLWTERSGLRGLYQGRE